MPGGRAAQLRLAPGEPVSEPTGHHSLSLILTNRATGSCSVFGYPGVRLADHGGRTLPFTYADGGDQVVTSRLPSPVDLAPGRSHYLTVNKYRCDLGDRGLAAVIEIRPPGDDQAVRLSLVAYPMLDYCGPGDPGTTVDVSPRAATFADTTRQ